MPAGTASADLLTRRRASSQPLLGHIALLGLGGWWQEAPQPQGPAYRGPGLVEEREGVPALGRWGRADEAREGLTLDLRAIGSHEGA